MSKQIWGNSETYKPIRNTDPDVIFREPSFIEIIDNKLYFYSEIERANILQLVKSIRQLNKDLEIQQHSLSLKTPINIELYINSYGGDVFAGLSALDEIINSKIPVVTIVDGCCASAATLFSVAGKKRFIKEHAYMLVHQITSCFWGKYNEFIDEMENQKRIMEMIKDIYLKYTKIPEHKLYEILKRDLWLDAKTCLKYKLVDDIL